MSKTLTAALVLCTSAAAWAQAPAAPKLARIAVIDMARISNDSKLGKSYATQLDGLKKRIDEEGSKKQAALDKMESEIKAMQADLEKQASVLSSDAAEKKRQEIIKKTRERQAYIEDGQAEMNKLQEDARTKASALNQEFQTKVRPHIEAAAKEKGYDILLDDQVALTVSKEFDITGEVITRLDAAEPAAAAPAAPAAGAAKPAPKPSPKP